MLQIPAVHTTQPRYALAPLAFPYRQLAALAGRAPIGGAREVVLACFLAARLAGDRLAGPLPDGARATRGTGAKGWLSTLAIPTPVRTPLARCLELSATGTLGELGAAVGALALASAEYLEPAARAELDALATLLSV
jgi:hypothetical protein